MARMAHQHPLAKSFRQARWYTPADGRQIDLVVIHSAETGELWTTAEAIAQYFATTDRRASAHFQCDNDSVAQSVRVGDVAYAAPGANHNGVHIEHAGRARQTRAEWLDAYSRVMLRDISAPLARALCQELDLPIEYRDADDLRAGGERARGITTHHDCSQAYGGTHWDPGPHFPMDLYLGWVLADDDEEDILAKLTDQELAVLRDLLASNPARASRIINGSPNESAGALAVWKSLDDRLARIEALLDAQSP